MQFASIDQIASTLDAFVRERFQVRPDDNYFNAETDLWGEGYLDSLGVVELVHFIETKFRVSVPTEMLFDSDFVRISGMARLIQQLADVTVTNETPGPVNLEMKVLGS
jgi:acyl carrier protein